MRNLIDNFYFDICLSDKVNRLVGVQTNSLNYRSTHRKHKCYKCHMYGHIAANCEDICKQCGLFHPESLCLRNLINLLTDLLENLSGEYRRDIRKFNKILEKEQGEIQEQNKEESMKQQTYDNLLTTNACFQIFGSNIIRPTKQIVEKDHTKRYIFESNNTILGSTFVKEKEKEAIIKRLSKSKKFTKQEDLDLQVNTTFKIKYNEWLNKIKQNVSLESGHQLAFRSKNGIVRASVYSVEEVDQPLKGKLIINENENYTMFTSSIKENKNKLSKRVQRFIDIYAIVKEYNLTFNKIRSYQSKIANLKNKSEHAAEDYEQLINALKDVKQIYKDKKMTYKEHIQNYGNSIRESMKAKLASTQTSIDINRQIVDKLRQDKEDLQQEIDILYQKKAGKLTEASKKKIGELRERRLERSRIAKASYERRKAEYEANKKAIHEQEQGEGELDDPRYDPRDDYL